MDLPIDSGTQILSSKATGGDKLASGEKENNVEVSKDGEELTIHNWSEEVKTALKDIGNDDPAVSLDWNTNKLNAAVAFANQHVPPLPGWMIGGVAYPIDALQLQSSIIQALANVGGGSVGHSLVAPNTLAQFAMVTYRLRDFMTNDPFMAAICGAANRRPLARIFVHADGKRKATAVHMGPLAGAPMAVFD